MKDEEGLRPGASLQKTWFLLQPTQAGTGPHCHTPSSSRDLLLAASDL